MLRYIKTNDIWIDTLSAQRDFGITYIVIDGKVISISKDNEETVVGEFQDEKEI